MHEFNDMSQKPSVLGEAGQGLKPALGLYLQALWCRVATLTTFLNYSCLLLGLRQFQREHLGTKWQEVLTSRLSSCHYQKKTVRRQGYLRVCWCAALDCVLSAPSPVPEDPNPSSY
jgi:hypothetical protein